MRNENANASEKTEKFQSRRVVFVVHNGQMGVLWVTADT